MVTIPRFVHIRKIPRIVCIDVRKKVAIAFQAASCSTAQQFIVSGKESMKIGYDHPDNALPRVWGRQMLQRALLPPFNDTV
mmetsp:Transcript_21229/g.31709  ORF Transcript_21229/g.31709 Transcript_21229/m.31709 type:complete len:81 (-) Transcript_21229:474-716(-)